MQALCQDFFRQRSGALNDEDAAHGGALAYFHRFSVLGGLVEGARFVETLELDHDDAFRAPIALEIFRLAAAYEKLAAILGKGCTDQLAVFFVPGRVFDLDRGYQIGGHWQRAPLVRSRD